ncbi:ParB/RepB/Spo0J family partition protein [Pandoraea oxalativorans]|uniref:ParB-like N-terminal domain-containing protein n=1 Tax=Pandoraea oxalativorans TaxID=573737 RepID=A0A0G3IC36_9BURK|nr:ParB/RepB/Spo0J family partition protein [Pandoraea oxalativorans]AKK24774.1 hypothetical protein MB84_28670 [Pandoraea oxalativorans]
MVKDFSKGLAVGRKLDVELNKTPASPSRFDRVDGALAGRESLLGRPQPGPDARALQVVQELSLSTSAPLELPLTELDDNPLNSRTIYSEEIVVARANSIREHGQLVPILVTQSLSTPGRYTIIDGQYRKRALTYLGEKSAKCQIIEVKDKVEFYKLARAMNNERQQESILDIAYGYEKLISEGLAKTEEELGSIVKDTKSRINKLRAVLKLPPAVHELITASPDQFGISIAYELTLYQAIVGAEKTVELAQRIASGHLPFTKVQAIRNAAAQGPKPRRNVSRQHKLRDAGIEIGTLKEWDSGRIVLDITVVDPAKRDAYLVALKHLQQQSGLSSELGAVESAE